MTVQPHIGLPHMFGFRLVSHASRVFMEIIIFFVSSWSYYRAFDMAFPSQTMFNARFTFISYGWHDGRSTRIPFHPRLIRLQQQTLLVWFPILHFLNSNNLNRYYQPSEQILNVGRLRYKINYDYYPAARLSFFCLKSKIIQTAVLYLSSIAYNCLTYDCFCVPWAQDDHYHKEDTHLSHHPQTTPSTILPYN